MTEPFDLTPDNPIIETLDFKPHRNVLVRRAVPFMPTPDQPQTLEVRTPWGALLTATRGDILISELDAPDDPWPIDSAIFDETYIVVGPGLCIKRALTLLIPLTEVTGGDEDRIVIVHTLEGEEAVRAGDFYLAKGVKGEIWPYPKAKVMEKMRPVD